MNQQTADNLIADIDDMRTTPDYETKRTMFDRIRNFINSLVSEDEQNLENKNYALGFFDGMNKSAYSLIKSEWFDKYCSEIALTKYRKYLKWINITGKGYKKGVTFPEYLTQQKEE